MFIWDWESFAAKIEDQPPPIDELQRLTISKEVSDSGTFNVTASQDFYFQSLLRNVLIEEPGNRTEFFDITVVQEADTDSDSLVETKFSWTVTDVTKKAITV